MLHQSFVTSPSGGINYLSLFGEAFDRAPVTEINAAIAYATSGGVLAIDNYCKRHQQSPLWRQSRKRWLIGIDYCRTEPIAIEMLMDLPNSEVRIHAGNEVVRRKKCNPKVTYHPKTFLLSGDRTIGSICGSGNLSRNGLTKGHEIGNLMITTDPADAAELMVKSMCEQVNAWFEAWWERGSRVPSILPRYKEVYNSTAVLSHPAPTDDDSGETTAHNTGGPSRGQLTPDQLRQLRAASNLWIEAGNITENRGPGVPGDQLMMKRMSRVYFGFPANDRPKDSLIGHIVIWYDGQRTDDRSIRFGNNGMDILTLPVPSNGGPERYDNKTLLFTKRRDGGFDLYVGTSNQVRQWRNCSDAIGATHSFQGSPRAWGVS